MQRLFLAWNPPGATRAALASAQATLRARERADGIRWTPPAQVHLTLRFLGPTAPERVAPLRDRVAHACTDLPPATARACEAEWWPDAVAPRVLIVRCASDGRIEALNAALERAARETGFPAERRTFRAHVTLARAGKLRRRVDAARHALPAPLPFVVDHVALVLSERTASGSRYRELTRWSLAAPER